MGLLFTVFGAASFVMQTLFIGRLSRAFGGSVLVVASSLCCVAAMLLVGEMRLPIGFVAGVALFGVGFGTTTTVLTSLASQSARGDMRGVVLGTLQSSGGLARTFGPLAGGMLFHRVAPDAPFLVGAAAALGAGALALVHRSLDAIPEKYR